MAIALCFYFSGRPFVFVIPVPESSDKNHLGGSIAGGNGFNLVAFQQDLLLNSSVAMGIIFIFLRPVYLFPPQKSKCEFPGHIYTARQKEEEKICPVNRHG